MKRPCDLLAAAFVLAMTSTTPTPSWGGPPIPMLVNELQRQERAIERQERELGELRGIVQRLGAGAAAGR